MQLSKFQVFFRWCLSSTVPISLIHPPVLIGHSCNIDIRLVKLGYNVLSCGSFS